VLATRFLARYCASNGLPLDAKIFSAEAIEQFRRYRWPGNIRELENTVSRAALTAPGRLIRGSDVEFLRAQATSSCGPEAPPRLPTLREAERSHIARALAAAAWNKKEASRILEISRGTLYRKIVEYGLDPNMNIP
jgi:DNA-binding NtrC family response regulator